MDTCLLQAPQPGIRVALPACGLQLAGREAEAGGGCMGGGCGFVLLLHGLLLLFRWLWAYQGHSTAGQRWWRRCCHGHDPSLCFVR